MPVASATALRWGNVIQMRRGGGERHLAAVTPSTLPHMHSHRPHSLTHQLFTPQVQTHKCPPRSAYTPSKTNRRSGKHICHKYTTHTCKHIPHRHKYTHLHTHTQICVSSTHTFTNAYTAHEHTTIQTYPACGIQRALSGITHELQPGAMHVLRPPDIFIKWGTSAMQPKAGRLGRGVQEGGWRVSL